MSMIIVTVDSRQKAISSRTAMRRTALTSPFYRGWVETTEQSLEAMLEACRDRDFSRIGRITETHAMRMHAVIQSGRPTPSATSRPQALQFLTQLRHYVTRVLSPDATADAGPNIAVISRPEDAQTVADNVLAEYGNVRMGRAGAGAKLLEAPLTEGTD